MYSRDIRDGTHSTYVSGQVTDMMQAKISCGTGSSFPNAYWQSFYVSCGVCVGEHGEGCHVVSSLSPIRDNFTHIRSRHAALFTNTLTCPLMFLLLK